MLDITSRRLLAVVAIAAWLLAVVATAVATSPEPYDVFAGTFVGNPD